MYLQNFILKSKTSYTHTDVLAKLHIKKNTHTDVLAKQQYPY